MESIKDGEGLLVQTGEFLAPVLARTVVRPCGTPMRGTGLGVSPAVSPNSSPGSRPVVAWRGTDWQSGLWEPCGGRGQKSWGVATIGAFWRVRARKGVERAMGFEPTAASLEGWRSAVELRPHKS